MSEEKKTEVKPAKDNKNEKEDDKSEMVRTINECKYFDCLESKVVSRLFKPTFPNFVQMQ